MTRNDLVRLVSLGFLVSIVLAAGQGRGLAAQPAQAAQGNLTAEEARRGWSMRRSWLPA